MPEGAAIPTIASPPAPAEAAAEGHPTRWNTDGVPAHSPDPAGPAASIRPRRPEDLPSLIEALGAQQPTSRYPFTWPLPFPAEQFIARDHELAAWVAEVDGTPVGHVSVQSVEGATGPDGQDGAELRALWTDAHGRSAAELAIVSALFLAPGQSGQGLGGRLLATAVEWISRAGLGACLDVLPKYSDALTFYERRGWVRVGQVRPPWLPDDEVDVIAMVLP